MKHFASRVVVALSLFSAPLALHANDAAHCEKKAKDGKVSTVEAKDKKACKKKGGNWVEAAKMDEAAPAADTHSGHDAAPAEESN